jgi:hypothetical protein
VKGDLERLIEAVEAGVTESGEFARALPMDHVAEAIHAYRGSLDAALRLHEALLPGWEWVKYANGGFAVMGPPGTSSQWGAAPDNPARAWLLAVLHALAKREEG